MDPHETEALLVVIRQLQLESRLTLQALGTQLGFSRSHLSMLFAGKRKPGLRFVHAVLRCYPQARGLVQQELTRRRARAAQERRAAERGSAPSPADSNEERPSGPDSR